MFENFPDVVNVSELSNMLGICEKTAYSLLRNNKIKYIKIGRVYKIPKIYVIEFLYKKN
ncbi:excisionase family DNA binding protein [Acetoanaerobium pronyense]|uniref:Excisionase family DNA binding protein n=1 Tax=Acetoanaerobium pronyense TaxID=1482736 RepID=A0ABS4KK10_9FIRM|nr:helix-turn-helix domain-containing protein [Acetoanaerobium pronyense]MBP2028121.1 excisionase family DNA binding protein [Acetoanaerobium pronyense]